jgi:hypothetical protein
LDQATRKLSFSNAARKLFTIDGTPVLDYQDLINFCENFYKKIIENTNEKGNLYKNKFVFHFQLFFVCFF